MHTNLYAEPRYVKIVYFVSVQMHTYSYTVCPTSSALVSIVAAGHLFFMVFGQLCLADSYKILSLLNVFV